MQNPTHRPLTRRAFAKRTASAAATAFGFQFVPSHVWGANERVTLAGIGTGGKGAVDVAGSASAGFQVVGLVDIVDTKKIPETATRFKAMAGTRDTYPDAAFFTDYREMLVSLGDKVDAVTVTTPDHHHFHAAYQAMKAGKHVYCQKPLTHGLWEARTLAKLAAETGVKTQMGNQGQANDGLRRTIELIRAGMIGKVKEVHIWTDRPIWPQGFDTLPPKEDVPPGIDWDQWVGPAPWVDYSSKIAPFNWRGWWDFGTGALGDMACHYMAMAYPALNLGAPNSIVAEAQGGTKLSPPITSTVTYDFADQGVKFVWYDGQKGAKFDPATWRLIPGEPHRPSAELLEGVDFKKYDTAIVGEKGKLFFGYFRTSDWIMLPSGKLDGFAWPEKTLPRARNQDPYVEWLDAIEGKIPQAEAHFGMSGPFTEMVLLGCLAQRFPGEKLDWDSAKLEVTNRPDLAPYIRREYREGWKVSI